MDLVCSNSTKNKRTWCYACSPASFDIPGCECGNHKPQWSEFENELWCSVCQKDFIPKNNGIFDVAIPVSLLYSMGGNLDKIDLVTGKYLRYDVEKSIHEIDSSINSMLKIS